MKEHEAIDTQTTVLMFALVTVLCLIVYGIFNQTKDESAKEAIDAFYNKKELICKESPIKYSKAVMVSKDTGWEIYGEYFKKDEMLLNVEICKSSK